eukprot:g32464.t1
MSLRSEGRDHIPISQSGTSDVTVTATVQTRRNFNPHYLVLRYICAGADLGAPKFLKRQKETKSLVGFLILRLSYFRLLNPLGNLVIAKFKWQDSRNLMKVISSFRSYEGYLIVPSITKSYCILKTSTESS